MIITMVQGICYQFLIRDHVAVINEVISGSHVISLCAGDHFTASGVREAISACWAPVNEKLQAQMVQPDDDFRP